MPINPTHDGFFAWLEHEEPETITEACAEHHVYLVPLRGGIRIGLCAMPTDAVERVAKTLATVLNSGENNGSQRARKSSFFQE